MLRHCFPMGEFYIYEVFSIEQIQTIYDTDHNAKYEGIYNDIKLNNKLLRIINRVGKCAICGLKPTLALAMRDHQRPKYSRLQYVGYQDGVLISFDIDHIRPISEGGLDLEDNKQLTCRRCNYVKGSKHHQGFLGKNFYRELTLENLKVEKDLFLRMVVMARNGDFVC